MAKALCWQGKVNILVLLEPEVMGAITALGPAAGASTATSKQMQWLPKSKESKMPAENH